MKTVWQYQLDVLYDQTLKIPSGGEILCVQVQNGTPCMWALVDTENELEDRTISIFGTGHYIDETKNRRYLGTIQDYGEGFIFHVFEEINKIK